MNIARFFRLATWALTLLVASASVAVWLPSGFPVTTYSLFPLFGLIAAGLMWAHYVSGAVRLYLDLADDTLENYFQITSAIVLVCIITHPLLLILQLYLDGLGLPPQSLFSAYPSSSERLAIVAAMVALIAFLGFELHRLYGRKPWWKYIEWANIGAMALVFVHSLTLGSELRSGWFRTVWLVYAVTFVASVAYTSYYKRRHDHAANRHV